MVDTFNLELSWRSVTQFLGNKFGWAKMLAAKKSVDLTVESNVDVASSSELVMRDNSAVTRTLAPAVATADSEGDVEAGCTLTSSLSNIQAYQNVYLHIDTYKIEQVIRNLITNAVRKRDIF